MDLKEKVALVTGGGRGIGRAISLKLAEQGMKIAVNYFRHPESARETANHIQVSGGEAMTVKADVADGREVNPMVDAVIRQWGRIDVLVNNAGYIEGGRLLDLTEQQWDRMMAVLLRGPFVCCKAVVPHMIQQHESESDWKGKIVNIGSVGGWGQLILHYCTAKGGLVTFTKSLARDLVDHQILVNLVAPGPTISDLGAEGPRTEAEYEKRRQHAAKGSDFPLGRIGEPEEVADAVLFFCTNDYVTGESISICGGWGTLYQRLKM